MVFTLNNDINCYLIKFLTLKSLQRIYLVNKKAHNFVCHLKIYRCLKELRTKNNLVTTKAYYNNEMIDVIKLITNDCSLILNKDFLKAACYVGDFRAVAFMCCRIFTCLDLEVELHIAAKYGNLDIVRYIYNRVVTTCSDKTIRDCFMCPIKYSKETTKNVTDAINFHSKTIDAFIAAALNNHMESMKFLYENEQWRVGKKYGVLERQYSIVVKINKCIYLTADKGYANVTDYLIAMIER